VAILIINFSSLNDSEFLTKARFINTSLGKHPALSGEYPSYVPSLKVLDQSIQEMQAACDAAAHRDSQKIKLKNEARKKVDGNLKKIGQHLELFAADDVSLLQNSGYDLRRSAIKVKGANALASPHLAVRHGDLSGTMIAKGNRVPTAGSYELQFTDGDPTVEESWRQQGIYVAISRIEVTGVQPGKNYSFRMRGISSHGPGVWSLVCTLMAI